MQAVGFREVLAVEEKFRGVGSDIVAIYKTPNL